MMHISQSVMSRMSREMKERERGGDDERMVGGVGKPWLAMRASR